MRLEEVRAALGRGDCLVAHDLAMKAVAADASDQRARYLAVLALARSGATQRAVAWRLAGEVDRSRLLAQDAVGLVVALADTADLTCHYVGPLPTAKGFGTLPLYALRRAAMTEA